MPYLLDTFDLRNIFDTIPSPCLLVDKKSEKILISNYWFSNLSEYSIDELTNSNLHVLIDGFNLDMAVDGGSVGAVLIKKSGKQVPIQMHFRYIGKIAGFLIIHMDTSENEKSLVEMIISLSSDLFKLIQTLDNQPQDQFYQKIWKVLSENKIADSIALYLLKEKESFQLGRIPEEVGSFFPSSIPTLELSRITGTDHWQPGRRVLSEIHRAGRDKRLQSIYTMPLKVGDKSIGLIVLGFQAESFYKESNFVIDYIQRLISTAATISETFYGLKSCYQDARTKAEKFSVGFDNTSDGILVLDDADFIIEFNAKFPQCLNYLPIELKGKPFKKICNYEGNFDPKEIYQSTKNRHTALVGEKAISLLDKKGENRYFELWIIPFMEGQYSRKMVFLKEISEEMKLRKSIERMERQATLGETLAEFAHDARNIINRQTTGIQLLAKKHGISVEENKEIANLLEDCDELIDMMESVLSYSRQNTDEYEEIDLTAFVKRLIYQNRYRAEKANVKVKMNSRLANAKIQGDQRSLERVLLNLINNAIDALKNEGGIVSVTLMDDESIPNHVVIKITDTGPGIPDSLNEVLLTSQYTDKGGGTGLGLLISKKIIEAHGGHIQLESFAGGTIFSIYLPKCNRGEEN